MQFPFLKEETFGFRTQQTFIGTKCLIYIEEKVAKNDALLTVVGNIAKTIGLFWFEVAGEMYELQTPVLIDIQFTDRYNVTKKLRDDLPLLNYTVFELHRGDAFCYDINHKQGPEDMRTFLVKMLENANLPATVSYNDSLSMLLKMFDAAGNKGLSTASVSYEFLISELYRWKGDENIPFRFKYKPDKPMDFKQIRSVKAPQVNSTFTGIIGEDLGTQILSGVVRNRNGNKYNRESPLEQIIKY